MREVEQLTTPDLIHELNACQLGLNELLSFKMEWPDDAKKKRTLTERIVAITAELDRRCTDAGIFSNGDGTFKMEPRFNMTVKEANEWLALSQYMVSKIKNER